MCKKMKKIYILLILFVVLLTGCRIPEENPQDNPNNENGEKVPSSNPEEEQNLPKNENILAHWKFQNVDGYYKGDINNDDLTFIDLTGNGNDMVVKSEGFGDELDIFTWDYGVLGTQTTSLKMNNSLVLAESVDPYDKDDTTYSGAFVSGKYLQTIATAPINYLDADSWSIEIVFKISPEWDNSYNRYVGIFSRQGVSKVYDEPYFSMAVASLESDEPESTILGDKGVVGLQYIQAYRKKINNEFANVKANEWIHYMAVYNSGKIRIYVNGNLVEEIAESGDFQPFDNVVRWEIGVGRKYGEGANTMNPHHPEGLIRRLFCGSISEIKFSSTVISIDESLYQQLK